MTTAQVVETLVTANNNSPVQDYVHPDDQTQPTFEMTPGFKPFTVLVTLLKMRPRYSQSSRENATPSSGTSPLASYKEVLPPVLKQQTPRDIALKFKHDACLSVQRT